MEIDAIHIETGYGSVFLPPEILPEHPLTALRVHVEATEAYPAESSVGAGEDWDGHIYSIELIDGAGRCRVLDGQAFEAAKTYIERYHATAFDEAGAGIASGMLRRAA